MLNREIKLIDPSNKELLNDSINNLTDFSNDTSNSELIDSGILLNDLEISGTFKNYQIESKNISPSIPDIHNRYFNGRGLENSDTFIKFIIKLNKDEKEQDFNKRFYFIQTRMSDAYNKKFDLALEKGLLKKVSSFGLYHENKTYEVTYYMYKEHTIAMVPNKILKNKIDKGHSWYLLSPIKGKVEVIDETPYFIPDKILYSGVSYKNTKMLLNISLPSAVRERKN